MVYELQFTSSPRGLKPGVQGFCTVKATRGIPVLLMEKLEALSVYRHGSSDPVVYSHTRLTVQGVTYHVVSRICDAGLDYSQRHNYFAHHFALTPDEMPAGGPTWLLSQNIFDSEWDGAVEHIRARLIPAGQSTAHDPTGHPPLIASTTKALHSPLDQWPNSEFRKDVGRDIAPPPISPRWRTVRIVVAVISLVFAITMLMVGMLVFPFVPWHLSTLHTENRIRPISNDTPEIAVSVPLEAASETKSASTDTYPNLPISKDAPLETIKPTSESNSPDRSYAKLIEPRHGVDIPRAVLGRAIPPPIIWFAVPALPQPPSATETSGKRTVIKSQISHHVKIKSLEWAVQDLRLPYEKTPHVVLVSTPTGVPLAEFELTTGALSVSWRSPNAIASDYYSALSASLVLIGDSTTSHVVALTPICFAELKRGTQGYTLRPQEQGMELKLLLVDRAIIEDVAIQARPAGKIGQVKYELVSAPTPIAKSDTTTSIEFVVRKSGNPPTPPTLDIKLELRITGRAGNLVVTPLMSERSPGNAGAWQPVTDEREQDLGPMLRLTGFIMREYRVDGIGIWIPVIRFD